MKPEERLKEIVDDLKANKERRETVRTLLSWFGFQRRGSWKAGIVSNALKRAGVGTDPDFTQPYIDEEISFVLLTKAEKKAASTLGTGTQGDTQNESKEDAGDRDPTYRIGRLEAANTVPVTVSPNATVSEAITQMMMGDFSHLPVVNGRTLKGVVSWKTIGSRFALKQKCETVQDVLEAATTVGADVSIFQAIQQIVEHDYVLVEKHDRTLAGIVTTSDLSLQFRALAEPFLILGEIENHLRHIIDSKFESDSLDAAKDERDTDRTVSGASDLTFGEYLRLLERDENWAKLETSLDRKTFIEKLDQVRRIRNDVMHFDPEGIEDFDLDALRDFVRFLRTLRATGVF